MERFDIPILFLTYHRLDTTRESFEKIREIQPTKLFIASDGPKENNPEDAGKVRRVREWLESAVDWECDVKKKYSCSNQGCRLGVSSAIDWVFQTEEHAIIIEDDIVADTSFFLYCKEMLEKYREDSRVMMISGFKRCWDFPIEGDYFFSKMGPICCGWATWRRAWQYFDAAMGKWPYFKTNGLLENLFGKAAASALKDEFDAVYEKRLDSWAYPWDFARYINSGLSILPKVNLATNIGFSSEGSTHSTEKDQMEVPVSRLKFPLKAEECIVPNWKYEREYEKRSFKKKTIRKFVRKHMPKAVMSRWYHIRGVKGY